jgi:hypothetical protein
MSAEVSERTNKIYSDCAVQTDVPPAPLPPIPPRQLSSPFHDSDDLGLTSVTSQTSAHHAYNHDSICTADDKQRQRLIKPRLAGNQPSDGGNSESNRTVSMPETAPAFMVKKEMMQSLRVVSLPERHVPSGYGAVADTSISSDSGNTSSFSGTSFASISDATTGTICPPKLCRRIF